MAAATDSKFLDLQALAALEQLRFTTRHRIEGAYSGRHASRQKGGSGEFVDYREYSPGEDLRRLDWKVYARTGKSYVRLFQDETNLLCTLAIDASSSMLFGAKSSSNRTGSKLEYAQYLATGFSHVISHGQDQVGLAVLGDQLIESIPCGGTVTHIRHCQSTIEQIETSPTLQLAPGLRQLFERTSSRGVLALMSDFLIDDLDDVFAAIRLFRHRQFEVILLHLVHPDEEQLPEGSSYRFEGLEGEGRIDCSPAHIRDEYARQFSNHLSMVRSYALSAGCDYRLVSTSQSYLSILSSFLVERSG
ncbi:DUF58 domain-containing protein [Thalassoglobus sp.]|uniref:DUF58 domain-containing protein n=1 Tax=Thalassoglobus sp. TaxID=2795869 RepID=UPI003AA906BE